jgi:uncharacterized membrane protein
MSTLLQWIHVTAAVIGVGGMAFLLLILVPSLGVLPPEQRDLLAKQVMKRFRWMIWSAILVLLLSGLYSIRLHYWDVAWGRAWALLTVKIVLAFFFFVIALGLPLPFKLFDWVRARRRLWLSIAVGVAVVVILIAAYLRR